MLIISQNLTNYNIPLPPDTVFRINLAWVNDLDELKTLLRKHRLHKIFLDLPVNRTKLPNNKYSLEDIIPIIHEHPNIEYFAISNVEKATDLEIYLKMIPKYITIVPKIENPTGVKNINEITSALEGPEKIIMLDHDDLYSALIKENEPPSKFKDYMTMLIKFCDENEIKILRTIGVIFSDTERRITQYIG